MKPDIKEYGFEGGWHNATEECLQAERTGYQPRPPLDVYWGDVQEGDKQPELVMPITVTRCVFMASASRDFAPQHHNQEYAQQRSKAPGMFLGTHFNIGMLCRYMTDWGGPNSTIRRTRLGMRRPICAGDDMIITGEVTKKYERNGELCVDIDINVSTQDGPAYVCGGTLALPTRVS
jgi:hypothetical protein